MKKSIVAANWKMYKTIDESVNFLEKLNLKKIDHEHLRIIICAPFTSLFSMNKYINSSNSKVELGAQNVYYENEGAFTGEISTQMLKESDIQHIIVGHSERRTLFNEDNSIVVKKAKKVLDENINLFFCIGETLEEREDGKTEKILEEQLNFLLTEINKEQLKKIIFAYEPVWAIGTGLSASVEQVKDAHILVRKIISDYFNVPSNELNLLYGGSVKSSSAHELSNIDEVSGFLIGGASLDVDHFSEISKIITEVKNV